MLPENRAVLVADDSPDDRYLMIEACREAGIKDRLALVEDEAQALEYLNGIGRFADRSRHPVPGLIILDIKMPNMDGLEALRKIRRSKKWKNVPVLMLTASGYPADVVDAYRYGAYAYLLKPSTLVELFELVRAIKGFWLRFNEYPPAPEDPAGPAEGCPPIRGGR